MNNDQLAVIFEDATPESVNQAIARSKARGNPLKAKALLIQGRFGAGFYIPDTIVNRKGQPRTLASYKQSARRWGLDADMDENGRLLMFNANDPKFLNGKQSVALQNH